MKLLLLGGTVFLGRHIVESALERGHEVTLFNRGQHNPDLFPNVEKLHGDRNGNLSAFAGRQWDAVIDTSGYVPRIVRASAEALHNSVKHYTFISSISVFAQFDTIGLTEDAPTATLEDETVEGVTNETYGALKALCEQVVEQVMPGHALIVRPGLIVGPDDPTDRFTYWPVRTARGGEMLAPGRPDQQTQFIDVRDLAAWIVRMIEARKTGVYNATGPDYMLTWGQFLEGCRSVANRDTDLVWVGNTFAADLMEKEVANFQPWAPEEYAGMRSVNCQKAYSEGLTFRPLAETIRDTLTWKNASPTGKELRSGLAPEQEEQLLREWKK
ncbi:MAG TPA: SDR family oxidoreductase [Ktedonobacteraceae bacterium]|nr:SDR family oxidoreductase [Ktedonobacteraceae bacterium]